MNKYLTKIAQLSSDTKKEISQTGVMAAAGAATGYIGHKTMETGVMRGIKIPAAGKAALAVGGIGLLGDYAAVKLNRHIEKKAHMVENKYLQKVANTYDSNTLAPLGKIDIGHAKDVTPTMLGKMSGRVSGSPLADKVRALKNISRGSKLIAGAGALAGIGGVAYAIKKSREKRAGLILNGLRRGVQRLGGQLKTLGQDFATAPKTISGMKSMAPSITPILRNRAVQAGVGVVGAGIVGRSLMNRGQQKQASVSGTNIYLEKLAFTYIVDSHSRDAMDGINSIHMNEHEVDTFKKAKSDYVTPGRFLKHVVLPAVSLGGATALMSSPEHRIGNTILASLLGLSVGGHLFDVSSRNAGHESLGSSRYFEELKKET